MSDSEANPVASTSVRFDQKLWADFRKRAIDEGRSAKAILQDMMRERLKQSSPIGNKSDFDSLTPSRESVIIPVRPTEKVHIEGLLAILRSGQADAIQTITESIKVLSMELEESRDAGVPEPKGKTTTRPSRSDADARGGVAGKVRKSVTSVSGKRD